MQARFKAFHRLITYLVKQISGHNLFNLAATLAFTSLLAFVPLFTVIFAMISQLPFVQGMAQEINHFVLTYFIPDVGADIENILNGFLINRSITADIALSRFHIKFNISESCTILATVVLLLH